MASSNNQERAHRICDVPKGHKKMTPIHGYAKMPLVTLEEAVDPLVSIVKEVKDMVKRVKFNCQNPPDNLSSDESASIMLYSLEHKPREKSFYSILNKALWYPDRSTLKPWFLYLKLVLTALSKIPSEKRYLHRGVKEDLINEYSADATFVWWGFSSCTTSVHVLHDDVFLGTTGTRTLFQIECHSSKDIRKHSMFKNEDEVLLPPGRQFKVISSLDAGNGLHIIQIKETDPANFLLEPLLTSHALPPANTLLPTSKTKPSGHDRNFNIEKIIDKCSPARVNLSGQELNDQDMDIVMEKTIAKKQCMILDLKNNEVTESGVLILANALRNNQYLEELIISHNNICDSGVRYLTSKMNSSILKRIDLARNDISDEGAIDLAEMLATNTSLLELSLNGNRIGNYGMNSLANALAHSNTHLELLNMSANKDVSDDSIDSIVNMMKHNQSLKRLELCHNDLSKDGEKKLHDVAESKRGFQLWLSHFT